MIGEPKSRSKRAIYEVAQIVLGKRTLLLIWYDALKLRARVRHLMRHDLKPPCTQLHLGSGGRHVVGWLNVDLVGSDHDIDFTKRLPWRSGSFSAIVSQHVIEHFDLFDELLPLLGELRRALRPGGEIWLSCPDMERICRLYIDGRARELVEDRTSRQEEYSTLGAPPQQIVNDLFHQWGEHKNLFDFEMLKWALESNNFTDIRKVDEARLLERFPGFPSRHDDKITLYVAAEVP
jgi:predicted SAM-dependent methyltransferase